MVLQGIVLIGAAVFAVITFVASCVVGWSLVWYVIEWFGWGWE